MPEKTKNRELPKISEDNDKFKFTNKSKTVVDENGNEHTLYRIMATKDMTLHRIIVEEYPIWYRIMYGIGDLLDDLSKPLDPDGWLWMPEDRSSRIRIYTIRVRKDDLGGFIEKEENLDHKSKAWVFPGGMVYGGGKVSGHAMIRGKNVQVSGNAQVYGFAYLSGYVVVRDNAEVCDDAEVSGYVVISGDAKACADAKVSGQGVIGGESRVIGKIKLHKVVITDGTWTYGDITEKNGAKEAKRP